MERSSKAYILVTNRLIVHCTHCSWFSFAVHGSVTISEDQLFLSGNLLGPNHQSVGIFYGLNLLDATPARFSSVGINRPWMSSFASLSPCYSKTVYSFLHLNLILGEMNLAIFKSLTSFRSLLLQTLSKAKIAPKTMVKF